MTKHLKPPAITDHMPISLRAYAKPKVDKSKKVEPHQKHKRKASPLPASPWVIVFDTETLIRHIGKEANRLEEQMMLGMDEEANPDYGMSPNEQSAIIAEIRDIKKVLGTRNVADILGISRYLFRQFLEGKVKLKIPGAALTNLRAKTIIRKAEKMAHLEEIRTSIEVMGLRRTARLLKRDASNLKRKLRDNG